MPAAYRHYAFNGIVIGATRLADGVSFLIPTGGESVNDRRYDSEEYRRYRAETADGMTNVDTAAPPPVAYAGQQTIENRVTTTGTAPAELFRATLSPLTGYTAIVHLVGIDGGNGNMRYIRATIAAKRLSNGASLVNDVGGTAARVLADHRDGAAGTWAITPSVSGNDFVITVVGAAGRTVNWFIRLTFDSFTPGGA